MNKNLKQNTNQPLKTLTKTIVRKKTSTTVISREEPSVSAVATPQTQRRLYYDRLH